MRPAPNPRLDTSAVAVAAGEFELGGLKSALQLGVIAAGERAAYHSVEFFVARVRNPNMRAAYAGAVTKFCVWCDARGLALAALSSIGVAAYIHELAERLSPSSTNVHLSGVRQWLEWLTLSGVLLRNPAAAMRRIRLSREEGKTPVLEREQARKLIRTPADDSPSAAAPR